MESIIAWIKGIQTVMFLVNTVTSAYQFVQNLVSPPVKHWIERLNNTKTQSVHIYDVLEKEPTIEILGPLIVSKEEAKIASKYRKELKTNDAVAILPEFPIWTDNPVVLRVYTTDYATVCALDKLGKRPTILSANVLPFCLETKELILHRRSNASRDYPGYLHTFGGAYMPPVTQARDFDHLSLIRAARRETEEESGISFDIVPLPKLLIGHEPEIGFVHLALLGVGISKKTLETAISNFEGKITKIKADDLPIKLTNEDWVPAGKAQVLGWLALGAPIGHRRIRFRDESGQQVFNRLVS